MKTVRFSVKWSGVDDTERALVGLGPRVRRGVVQALGAISLLMQNHARRGIQKGPKTGKIYRRKTVVHQASAPGEFPATDGGDLVRSVLGDVDSGTLEARLTAGTKYAKWLEMGTRLMRPRPFMIPTLNEVSKKAPALFKQFIGRSLNG